MALWYRNMGGMIFEINSPRSVFTAESWIQCATPAKDPTHIRGLWIDDPVSQEEPSPKQDNVTVEETDPMTEYSF